MSQQFDAPMSPLRAGDDEVIHTAGLTSTYRSGTGERARDLTAVDHLDLSVGKGEIFGLLGPNGAGKTTTVGMLTTRVVPTSGRVTVNGIDIVENPAAAKRFIGVVHQGNTLDRSLTVWENLYFHGRYFGMSAREARQQADDLLGRFRLGQRAHTEVRTLSGGMARRLMVARAVMHRPSVLFLDEPTASLDPQSRLALWEIVVQLHDEGQTILLTTHYMEEAEEFCDRVAIMDHGRVLALDTPAGLKRAAAGERMTPADAKAWLARRGAMERNERGIPANGNGDGTVADPAGVESALLEMLSTAEREGVSFDDVKVPVTLETVFINLTGRELRE